MRKQDTISRKRTAQILREEIAAFKLQEEILSEHQKLVDQRRDFQSILALCLAEQITGKRITDPMVIEEGVWSKIKYYMGKLGSLEKGGKFTLRRGKAEAEAYAEKVAPALENAADDTVKKLVKQLEEEYPEFPNMEHNEEFSGALQQIGVAYDTVVKAAESGEMEAAQANALIDQLKEVVKYFLDYKLADAYKHLKEEEELDENKIIEEARLDRLLKKIAFGEPSKRVIRVVKRIADRAAKSGDDAGKLGKIRDALVDTDHANIADRAIKTYRRVAQAGTAGGGVASAAAGGGAGAAGGGAAGGGGVVPGGGVLPTTPLGPAQAAAAKTVGTGATSLATGAAVAYWASVLGVAVVTSGAAVMLLRKLKTDHRKSQFEAFLNTMENVPSDTPETDEMLGQPPSEETEDGGGGEPGEPGAEAGKDIYVFKGKGGKGMQSQLAKVGVQGRDMSGLLKGLRADLTDAGFNVMEEAKREVIALTNTLAALEQMADPAQKEAAKKILVQMLRANRVKLGPQDSRALAPAAAGGETPPPGGETPPPGGETPPPGGPPGGEAEMAAGDAFTYTSGGGAQSAVKVDDPNPNPSKPNLVSVHRIDPETCQDIPNSEFSASKQALGAPIDKCGGPAADRTKGPTPEIPISRKHPDDLKDPTELPEGMIYERWHKLAGIIKG